MWTSAPAASVARLAAGMATVSGAPAAGAGRSLRATVELPHTRTASGVTTGVALLKATEVKAEGWLTSQWSASELSEEGEVQAAALLSSSGRLGVEVDRAAVANWGELSSTHTASPRLTAALTGVEAASASVSGPPTLPVEARRADVQCSRDRGVRGSSGAQPSEQAQAERLTGDVTVGY